MKRKVGILGIGSVVDRHLQIIEELVLLGLHSFSYDRIEEDPCLFQKALQNYLMKVDVLLCIGDKTCFSEELFTFSSLRVLWLPADFSLCKKLIRDLLSDDSSRSIALDLQKEFIRSGKTLAVAESCTGGYISHLITLQPGSSQYFLGSFITYSNALKKSLLGVSEETLQNFGAVSSQTVQEMAKGVLLQTGADFAIAVSGVAGPEGGTACNPVGSVWIAVGCKNGQVESRKLQIIGDRQFVIFSASHQAVSFLIARLNDFCYW